MAGIGMGWGGSRMPSKEYLTELTPETVIPEAIHIKGLSLVKSYCICGGMPEAVKTFIETDNIARTQETQPALSRTKRFHEICRI